MINPLLLQLVILSASTATPIDVRHSEAAEEFSCSFEEQADKNYNNWPDGWKRRRARGYPLYLPIEIVTDETRSESNRVLRIQLDGGAAQVYTPHIEISRRYSYVLRGLIKTDGLQHDVAYFAITFLDDEMRKLETYTSEKIGGTQAWKEVGIGPLTPQNPAAKWATIELHLKPTEGADLVGEARFDDVWLGALPRMSIATNSPFNVFTDPNDIAITCRVSGFKTVDPKLKFELFDVEGRQVLEHQTSLHADDETEEAGAIGESGVAHWRNPPIPGNGFYTVRTSLAGKSDAIIQRTVRLAVVERQPVTKQGEFGWSLPQGDDPLSTKDLAELAGLAGIHWVKFPIWYSGEDTRRADELAAFAERLGAHQIQLIGLLDVPPHDVKRVFGQHDPLPVASVFVEPDVWGPAVDPVMTRLSLKVHWWQLGGDNDTSFVNFPNLEDKIRSIASDLNRFGQEINLGIALRSIDQRPRTKEAAPWSFLSFTSHPPLTEKEIGVYFPSGSDKTPVDAQSWLILEPISSKTYDLQTRAADLVARMVAAKIAKVDGVFLPNPFDPQHGLMDRNGSPAELFLAWRTTTGLISGSEYIGSVRLPSNSTNHFFVRDGKCVMVAWNDEATTETVYLGKDVRVVDLWGRETVPETERADDVVRQVIPVGRLPIFVTGVSPDVARWRMKFEFETKRLASVFGRDQVASYRFVNTMERSVGGYVTLETPIMPELSAVKADIKLGPSEEQRERFQVRLGSDINSGTQPIQANFHVGDHSFSVYRTIEIGLGDVVIELTTEFDADGGLRVIQKLENKTDEFVSFTCLLFAKGRKRQRQQIYNLGRGDVTKEFYFEDAADLIGTQLNLRAQEIDGVRELNYHAKVKPPL